MAKTTSQLGAILTPKRRWFQFRLLTLFVLVAVVAIPCAWLKWKINRKAAERAAVAKIRRIGGRVYYD
jgi:hypothetical protein